MKKFFSICLPFVALMMSLSILPQKAKTQDLEEQTAHQYDDGHGNNHDEDEYEDSENTHSADTVIEQIFNYQQKGIDQTDKHFLQTGILQTDLFPEEADHCRDTCCKSKRQVRFLQGLQYLMEDEWAEPLYLLEKRHDQLLGKIVFFNEFVELRKKYINALVNIQESSTHTDTIDTMEQMIFINKIVEEIIEDHSFLELLINASLNKQDVILKIEEHFQCQSDQTSWTPLQPSLFCQMFQVPQRKVFFGKMVTGLLESYQLQIDTGHHLVYLIFEQAMSRLNGMLPMHLRTAIGKENLLRNIKNNSISSIPDFSSLDQEIMSWESDFAEFNLQILENIKLRMRQIRSHPHYITLQNDKEAELNQLYTSCEIPLEEAPSTCTTQGDDSEEDFLTPVNGENWYQQGPLSQKIFSHFDDAYRNALLSKDSTYLNDVILNKGPESFSNTSECKIPFCEDQNIYFNSSLNSVSKKKKEVVCPETNQSSDRTVASTNDINENTEWLDQQEERIKTSLTCALNKVYPPPPPAMKRIRTLNFISRRLAKKFHDYGLNSDREKAHFLSQIVHETGGLSSTIENRAGISRWRSVTRGRSPAWDCSAYLGAVENDKNFFDNIYKYSKNRYKSAFRGRGLIQLTFCNNYLQFFYHKAALEAGRMDLANRKTDVTFYTTDDWGDLEALNTKMYCSENTLRQVAEHFEREGLVLRPPSLVTDFEQTVNELALPCQGRGGPSMSSEEFIVDSSLWYWQRNCRKDYQENAHSAPDKAVRKITQCIHGRVSVYNTFTSSSCNANGTPKASLARKLGNKEWYLRSFCHRLKLFKSVDECLGESGE